MPQIALTSQQLQAVRTTGCSILVSASAGSGKTAVLAERCAYLVCDAPPPDRCNVDELLVLTFTDAAAAEMRGRIVEAIRLRLAERPDDDRLAEQIALIGAARISTIHSFCLWLIRRWFGRIGLDPAAEVLDADEAALLKSEVLGAVFTDFYTSCVVPDDPLGGNAIGPQPQPESPSVPGEALGRAFTRLVDDYGLGDDSDISKLILKLADFVSSLPDADGWLREAIESVGAHPRNIVAALVAELRLELSHQADHCVSVAATMAGGDPVGRVYAQQILDYAKRIGRWREMLPGADDAFAGFARVQEEIKAYEFERLKPQRLPKDADRTVSEAKQDAAAARKHIKDSLFKVRLQERFGLFSIDELLSGLARTAPYVATIVAVVQAFRKAYAARKRQLGVMDFADLERFAYLLLTDNEDDQAVARSLRRRFAYLLVDEFQDINPLQQAIIERASRESDKNQANNLFVVGDVKQSIYRFRLAEPALFIERHRQLSVGGSALFLQRNFRSRPAILEGVNLIFRRLMPIGGGDIVYEREAEMQPGRNMWPGAARHPIQLHVLERTWTGELEEEDNADSTDGDAAEAGETGYADLGDPEHWTPIEREAYFIGKRIGELRDSAALEPARYRDIAVLLRAVKFNAERMAAMLSAMGVPAHSDAHGGFLTSLEVRDVVAALQVMDNVQQDIPLASVLRSGVLGGPLSEDDLVEIRCIDRLIPFHEAVRRYPVQGGNESLRERVSSIVRRIGRYREEARRRPLAEVLWRIYEREGYAAYACGLPHGPQRYANLLKLHDLARKFGTFRRQGLHRFLRFLQSLEDSEQGLGAAPSIGEADDVVRIMSIHQSKGLQFPIVFVAGLGTKFNLGDRSGRMIFERRSKIGLRVVDTERMIEYPSAAHTLVAAEIEASRRQEELRVLYVAMTRAKDRLILVGSRKNVDRLEELRGGMCEGPSLLSLQMAATPLDWLLPALATARPGAVQEFGSGAGGDALFEVMVHDATEMEGWRVERGGSSGDEVTRRAVAEAAPLPATEPIAVNDPQVEAALGRVNFVYPYLALSSVRAAIGASEFKGAYDWTSPIEQRAEQRGADDAFAVPPSKYGAAAVDSAIQRGILTHRVMQHLDLSVAVDGAGVGLELARITAAGLMTAEGCAAVDRAGVEWFVSTPLAAAIRKAGAAYRREFQYIAAESPAYFDPAAEAPVGDEVLVRGIVDGILPRGEGIEIVDFKTDAVLREAVAERAERYRPQMELYSRAMSRMWRRPVTACWLVFLAARETAMIEC